MNDNEVAAAASSPAFDYPQHQSDDDSIIDASQFDFSDKDTWLCTPSSRRNSVGNQRVEDLQAWLHGQENNQYDIGESASHKLVDTRTFRIKRKSNNRLSNDSTEALTTSDKPFSNIWKNNTFVSETKNVNTDKEQNNNMNKEQKILNERRDSIPMMLRRKTNQFMSAYPSDSPKSINSDASMEAFINAAGSRDGHCSMLSDVSEPEVAPFLMNISEPSFLYSSIMSDSKIDDGSIQMMTQSITDSFIDPQILTDSMMETSMFKEVQDASVIVDFLKQSTSELVLQEDATGYESSATDPSDRTFVNENVDDKNGTYRKSSPNETFVASNDNSKLSDTFVANKSILKDTYSGTSSPILKGSLAKLTHIVAAQSPDTVLSTIGILDTSTPNSMMTTTQTLANEKADATFDLQSSSPQALASRKPFDAGYQVTGQVLRRQTLVGQPGNRAEAAVPNLRSELLKEVRRTSGKFDSTFKLNTNLDGFNDATFEAAPTKNNATFDAVTPKNDATFDAATPKDDVTFITGSNDVTFDASPPNDEPTSTVANNATFDALASKDQALRSDATFDAAAPNDEQALRADATFDAPALKCLQDPKVDTTFAVATSSADATFDVASDRQDLKINAAEIKSDETREIVKRCNNVLEATYVSKMEPPVSRKIVDSASDPTSQKTKISPVSSVPRFGLVPPKKISTEPTSQPDPNRFNTYRKNPKAVRNNHFSKAQDIAEKNNTNRPSTAPNEIPSTKAANEALNQNRFNTFSKKSGGMLKKMHYVDHGVSADHRAEDSNKFVKPTKQIQPPKTLSKLPQMFQKSNPNLNFAERPSLAKIDVSIGYNKGSQPNMYALGRHKSEQKLRQSEFAMNKCSSQSTESVSSTSSVHSAPDLEDKLSSCSDNSKASYTIKPAETTKTIRKYEGKLALSTPKVKSPPHILENTWVAGSNLPSPILKNGRVTNYPDSSGESRSTSPTTSSPLFSPVGSTQTINKMGIDNRGIETIEENIQTTENVKPVNQIKPLNVINTNASSQLRRPMNYGAAPNATPASTVNNSAANGVSSGIPRPQSRIPGPRFVRPSYK
ncbi:hypothetical protein TKK_0016297 [Trichogramma kaykai]|uniref:Ataxin-2 C-terminal domain-containing protein n=1 Tax=Trichogramma kaykai TaxID=54128 RepID=A0ABD2W803_9HYME